MTLVTWHLAICQDCDPILPQPFVVRAERDTWAGEHSESTGHRVLIETEHHS